MGSRLYPPAVRAIGVVFGVLIVVDGLDLAFFVSDFFVLLHCIFFVCFFSLHVIVFSF
jgi:hypothetical protein